MYRNFNIVMCSTVLTFTFISIALAKVTQTSGTGKQWNALCKRDGVACTLTGSGGGIDTYSACGKDQCYTVSCSSEQPDKLCIKEESPSRRVGTKYGQTVRRLLGSVIVRDGNGGAATGGGQAGGGAASGGGQAGGGSAVGTTAPSGPGKGSGCSGGVC